MKAKSFVRVIAIAFVSMVAFCSCSKSDDGIENPKSDIPDLYIVNTNVVNGQTGVWTGIHPRVTFQRGTTLEEIKKLNITIKDQNGKDFKFRFKRYFPEDCTFEPSDKIFDEYTTYIITINLKNGPYVIKFTTANGQIPN